MAEVEKMTLSVSFEEKWEFLATFWIKNREKLQPSAREALDASHRSASKNESIEKSLLNAQKSTMAKAFKLARWCPLFRPQFSKMQFLHCSKNGFWLGCHLCCTPNNTTTMAQFWSSFPWIGPKWLRSDECFSEKAKLSKHKCWLFQQNSSFEFGNKNIIIIQGSEKKCSQRKSFKNSRKRRTTTNCKFNLGWNQFFAHSATASRLFVCFRSTSGKLQFAHTKKYAYRGLKSVSAKKSYVSLHEKFVTSEEILDRLLAKLEK